MNLVIMGCGRSGAHLAGMLAAAGHQVTVIDKDRVALSRLGEDFPGRVFVGNGIDEDVLREAGIGRAEAFVAVTDRDNTNIMAAQVARDVFGVPRVLCRIYDPLRAEIYRSLGLEVICPTFLAANQIKEFLGC